jgi:hypothetical protein
MDPASGRFLSLDPFAGNTADPLSLHKYLYTHANPIMGVDPTGLFEGLVGVAVGNSIASIISEMNVSVGESVLSSVGFDQSLDGFTQAISAAGSWVWDQLPQSVQDALSSAFDSAYAFVADHIDEIAVGAGLTAVAFAGNFRQTYLFRLYNDKIASGVTNFVSELGLADDVARRHLRRSVKGSGEQVHHIIPWETRSHELIQRAARGGFNINGARNGIRLGTEQHLGPHKKYNDAVVKKLDQIWELNRNISDIDAAAAIEAFADQLRAGLNRSNKKLR